MGIHRRRIAGLFGLVVTGWAGIRPRQREDIARWQAEAARLGHPEVRYESYLDPGTATALGFLPFGVGGFYVHRPGLAVSGFTWPISLLWLPAKAHATAELYNYMEFRERILALRQEAQPKVAAPNFQGTGTTRLKPTLILSHTAKQEAIDFLRDFIDAACGRALQAGPRMLPAWLHGAAARLASSLLVVLTAAPRADGACNATCRRDIARCMATQCARVGREACRRRCKPVAIRTLAYVVSECRMDAAGLVTRQALRIRRGDREPITVAEFGPTDAIPDPSGVCRGLADGRWGGQWVQYGALQRLGVSPDGSGVVFEVTDEFSPFPPLLLLSPEQKGFFFVRADGRGRPRRLGPASRDRTFRSGGFSFAPPMPFSPNGRRIAFTDLGSGPGSEEAVQIVVLDLAADQPTPTQVTHLPSGTAPGNFFDDFFLTCCPTFIDDETVVFQTFTDPDGSNPEHDLAAFKVRIDGTNLKRISLPVAVEGTRVVPTLGVLGRGTDLLRLPLPGTPVSPPTTPPTDFPITEVFVQSGKNLLLQLTKFRRADTFIGFLNPTHTRAFFLASAPSRANPHANCQLFSIGTNGSGLRQITHFGGTDPFIPGCFTTGFFLPRACGIGYGYYRVVVQDPLTRAVVFDSSCDPLGANPFGDQVFAMRPDGHGLRQLTDASGFTTNPDGSIRVELPGPFAYSGGPP